MLKTALMFGDGCVLQREKRIAVWGECSAEAEVTVSVQGQHVSVRADENGKWLARLDPLSVSSQEELIILSGNERLVRKNVMVGDVYFAGGQSNMEFYMRYDADLKWEKRVCQNSMIRFFEYPKVSFDDQLEMADYLKEYGFWRDCDSRNLERFSAVSYYFASKLQHKYKIPIGILACNWGGTPSIAWVPEKISSENGNAHRIQAYHELIASLNMKEYDKIFFENPLSFYTDPFQAVINDMIMYGYSPEEIESRLDELKKNNQTAPEFLDPDKLVMPMGSRHSRRPAGIYESMLLHCVPYGIRAILWYQGCSDSDTKEDAEAYRTMFPALIKHWRELWNDEKLPFLFVQLAPLKRWMTTTGEFYPITREAQQWTADHVPYAYMAVTTDVGMEGDIHPKKKKPVGERLALLAEHYIYEDNEVLCEAPALMDLTAEAGRVVLKFANAGEGLRLKACVPYGQYIGKDKAGGLELYQENIKLDLSNAKAYTKGDCLIVESPEIHPVRKTRAVLAKTGWFLVNLYNSADIPARPGEV